jgi:hypothetical protein
MGTAPSLRKGYSRSTPRRSATINSWIGQGARANPKIKEKMAQPLARMREISWEALSDIKMLPQARIRRRRNKGSISITLEKLPRDFHQPA